MKPRECKGSGWLEASSRDPGRSRGLKRCEFSSLNILKGFCHPMEGRFAEAESDRIDREVSPLKVLVDGPALQKSEIDGHVLMDDTIGDGFPFLFSDYTSVYTSFCA
jgi:hypothetical protein